MKKIYEGKVRDVYDLENGRLILDATNRLSAFDIVLADEIPDKGEVLNRLSYHHMQKCEQMGIKTHTIQMLGPRETLVYALKMLPVEVVARDYMFGSMHERYQGGERQFGNARLPDGLVLAEKLPETVIEFTTKREKGDRPLSYKEVVGGGYLTPRQLEEAVELGLKIHHIVSEGARPGGIIVADEKMEFGLNPEIHDGLVLGDELGTPDSSRFWEEALYKIGISPPSYDKQFARDFLLEQRGWKNKAVRPEAGTRMAEPILTPEIVDATRRRYISSYKKITGVSF